MFIEASVTPAKASRSASRGLIGSTPPRRSRSSTPVRASFAASASSPGFRRRATSNSTAFYCHSRAPQAVGCRQSRHFRAIPLAPGRRPSVQTRRERAPGGQEARNLGLPQGVPRQAGRKAQARTSSIRHSPASMNPTARPRRRRNTISRSSPTSRPCSTPSTSTRSSSSCRRWTPAARTARSSTCSAASIRKASTSPASSSRPRSKLAHDFLWRVHPHAPGTGRNRRFSTVRTTRTCW